MTVDYRIGDVFQRLAEIPDGSIDLVCTSPPFLALRSYLPADHPHKAKEIGSELSPAAFLDTMLALTVEWRRVLAPHGSIAIELGDTFSGSGGAGGDYNDDGLRAGQAKFRQRTDGGQYANHQGADTKYNEAVLRPVKQSRGWPLDKSLTGIPTLYAWSLAYGRNLLNPEHTIEPWRVRNLITWLRPNPPVGALGDKWRPASSFITVACVGRTRYFDLDAVRSGEYAHPERVGKAINNGRGDEYGEGVGSAWSNKPDFVIQDRGGAPPLDWHSDLDGGVGHLILATQPFRGAHYATFPEALPAKLISCMAPMRVCRECGKPSERVTGEVTYARTDTDLVPARLSMLEGERVADGVNQHTQANGANTSVIRQAPTLGFSDCGHNAWRQGRVLDCFGGSGTTGAVAQGLGRDCILIDLDETNAELARDRVGMFLTVDYGEVVA